MTSQMIGTVGDFVLVRGVVYKLVREFTRSGERRCWLRLSVPPDCPLVGKRSKWPARYPESRLPAHEPIEPPRAREIQTESLRRLRILGVGGYAP